MGRVASIARTRPAATVAGGAVALLIWLLAGGGVASAAPASPRLTSVEQTDGSIINARTWGDEWNNGFETARGYTIVQAPSSGAWTYARRGVGGRLVASDRVVGEQTPGAVRRHLRPSPSARDVPASARTFAGLSAVGAPPANVGTQKALVILVNFPDQAAQTTAANWSSAFFAATDSVKDYYDEVSYGNLTIAPATETSGTANDGVVGWLTMGYDHPNTAGSTGAANKTLAADAISAADPYVDYASYDTDADGYIEPQELHIAVIVAGYEAAYDSGCGNSVWGHHSSLVVGPTLDGVVVGEGGHGGYTQFGEIHCDHMASIGIMVHELGHDLSLPDLYDTDFSSRGVGYWSVMGGGMWLALGGQWDGATPAHPDAFSKSYEGWITPTALTGDNAGVAVPQAETSATAYRLLDNPGGVDWTFRGQSGTGEYFLVENRQLTGYDAALPGCGLLIWHIDEGVTSTNLANADESRKLVDLEEADGFGDLDVAVNRGDDGDPYPGSTSNATFDDASSPGSGLNAGWSSGVSVDVTSGSCASTMNADVSVPMADAASLALTIADASGPEGSDFDANTIDFTVTLSKAAPWPVGVDWTTAESTADASDFSVASGSVTFDPGQTSKQVSVDVWADPEAEADEEFSVELSFPTGAGLGVPATATGTILNDDVKLSTQLSITAPSKVAAGKRATIKGVLSSGDPTCTDSLTVRLKKGSATAGSVSTGSGGAYSFKLKVTRKTTVQVVFDGTVACEASASVKKTIRLT